MNVKGQVVKPRKKLCSTAMPILVFAIIIGALTGEVIRPIINSCETERVYPEMLAPFAWWNTSCEGMMATKDFKEWYCSDNQGQFTLKRYNTKNLSEILAKGLIAEGFQ